MSKTNYLKSGAWYMIGNLLIKGISFITLPIFTRLLTTGDFGKFNLFISYESILNVVIGLGIAGTIKTAYFDYADDFKKYFSSILSLIIIFALIVDAVVNIVLLIGMFSGNELWNTNTGNLLVMYSLATALYNLISMKYVIECSYKKNLGISFAYTFFSVGISLILCLTVFSNQRYMARILGNAVPLIIITYMISIKNMVSGRCVYNRNYWNYALKMGVPLIFHSLSLVIMQQADKIMVNGYCGSDLTGIYSLACNISLILTIVQSSIDNSWAPWFYMNLDKKNYSELVAKNGQVVFLFSYLVIGFNLISPELIKITSPNSYHSAIHVLIPLNLSVYASFMYMFAVNKEYFYKKTPIIAAGTIFTTMLDVGLNAILIPRFGFISAAYTTLISKIVLFIIHLIASNKIDKNSVVNTKWLVLSFLIVGVSGAISMICRELFIIRYVIIIVITSIAFTYFRKQNIIILRKEGK